MSGSTQPAGATISEHVAVIVVHGVADQQPHESARAIAQLLSGLNRAAATRYASFEEDDLRIDVTAPQSARGESQTFYARARSLAKKRVQAGGEAANRDPGIVMMEEQLHGYQPSAEETTYRTVRLDSTRTVGNESKGVHVYEMYWADQSRVGRGAFRIFGELYQLLLHVPSLGRHAVDAAGIEDGADIPAWRRLIELQRWAAYVLTVVIPLLNLWLLACVLVGLSGPLVVEQLADALRPLPALAIVGLAALVGVAQRAASREPPLAFWMWAIVPLLGLALFAGSYVQIRHLGISFTINALVALALVGGLGRWIVQRYQRTNPHARRFGRGSLAIVVAALAWEIVSASGTWTTLDRHGVMTAAFHVAELVFAAVSLAWLAAFALQLAALVTGRIALRRARREAAAALPPDQESPDQESSDRKPLESRADRLARAEHTAKLTLAIPAVAFIILTMVLWAALFQMLHSLVDTSRYTPLLLQHVVAKDEVRTLTCHSEVAKQMLLLSTPELIVLLALTGLALLLALWGLIPLVASEIRLPKDGAEPRLLGQWLDRAFPLLRYAGVVLILASALVVPTIVGHTVYRHEPTAAVIGDVLQRAGVPKAWLAFANQQLATQSTGALELLGTIVAGAGLGLFAFGGRLKMLTGGIRPVLDVLLDVDNYLREHPEHNNPRARIFARYIALLRHLCQWKDPNGQGYARIVIIAHSQGTVISADLLRFLESRRTPEPSLAPLGREIALSLFTMGSPLRQLYGLRFPHLYRWARHLDPALTGNGGNLTIENQVLAPPLSANQLPNPRACRLVRWVNVYRSGDYVGRHLWRRDRALFGPAMVVDGERQNVSLDAQAMRQEFCIGTGAHLHYWDPGTPLVAETLDELIASARHPCAARLPPRPDTRDSRRDQ